MTISILTESLLYSEYIANETAFITVGYLYST